MFQYTLPAGLLITGNMRGELAGFRNNNANNISLALAVHIRNAGTHKATLISYFPAATNFFGFFPGHVAAFPSTAITDDGYITVAGDILYVELGLGWAVTASTCGITTVFDGNTGNDWAVGANGTPDTNPTVKNPWIEFETTLAAAPAADDPLATFSASTVTARPFSPSKPGLHFFARDTNILSIWNGTAWKSMVSSINGVGGNLTFANTTDIDVTLTGSTFTWNAQALSVQAAAPRTKTIILTDDGTEGATLTCANTFSVNRLFLRAPNPTDGLRIYPDGGIAIGAARSGTAAVDVAWVKSEAAVLQGFDGDIANTGSGAVVGLTYAVQLNPVAANANSCTGLAFTASMGANATGSIRGLTAAISASAVSSRGDHVVVRGTINSLLSNTSTNVTVFEGNDCINAVGGTLTNFFMYNSTNLRIGGTLRAGYNCVGASGGSSASVYNFRGLVHSIGTNRFGVWTDNQHYCDDSDFVCGTAAKGLIVKDTQGTPEFWRTYPSVSGTTVKDATWTTDADGFASFTRAASATGSVILNIKDTGTTAPVA